jgi:aerobic-type carbon monoxide dehydrogenase small subunit (CoxS/CutS family)
MPVKTDVSLQINGKTYRRTIEPRLLLSDFIRHEVGLKGTHVGCEHGVCGACTVMIDGRTARSCLHFAVAVQRSHGLQCGYCTPGFLMTTLELLTDNPAPTRDEIRSALTNNICRCTGYTNIVKAVELAAKKLASRRATAAE